MSWFRPKAVEISFIDDETGATIAATRMPPADVPESFAVDTTLHLGDTDWSVVRAEPLTRAEYARSGSLTLWLRRVQKIDPRSILFSLPSICDRLAAVGTGALRGDELLMAEDDWRQLELVSRQFAPQADAEIQAIRRIHEEEWTGVAWRNLHVRSQPDPPIAAALTRADVAGSLAGVTFRGVGYEGTASPIESGFSFVTEDGLRGYGVEKDGRVTVLGIVQSTGASSPDRSVHALAELARRFDLLLANWCRCALVEPDSPLFRQLLTREDDEAGAEAG
jgi:hypothetical protein